MRQLNGVVVAWCLLLMLLSSAHATTIVAIWTPNQIILAADGKPTCFSRGGKIAQCQNAGGVCKIGQVGGAASRLGNNGPGSCREDIHRS